MTTKKHFRVKIPGRGDAMDVHSEASEAFENDQISVNRADHGVTMDIVGRIEREGLELKFPMSKVTLIREWIDDDVALPIPQRLWITDGEFARVGPHIHQLAEAVGGTNIKEERTYKIHLGCPLPTNSVSFSLLSGRTIAKLRAKAEEMDINLGAFGFRLLTQQDVEAIAECKREIDDQRG